MSWYAAHVVMVVQRKSNRSKRFPVWENIVLIQADSEDEAFTKAAQHGRSEAGDDGGTFTWEGQPARWIFAGVRKITACADVAKRPSDGTEITYNEFEFDSPELLEKYLAGGAIRLQSTDQFTDSAFALVEMPILASQKKRA